MVKSDKSDVIKKKVKEYSQDQIVFTKFHILDWLCKRNKVTIEEMKDEILYPKDLAFTEKQQVDYKWEKEERFRCYFV